ncbi:glutathione S-transferase [Acaromyces ingoldii]|uniref:Glutathione S-transferase n=1 Tax=Acaromyces ingoldii TaxID=215250 RepID=A0A316YW14_9BASI|nr:glutathione S-transferase [Acaromyces ingoldii]PWN93637.1 glutathione S-transferase [Acaromyces ingoldii]
MSSQPAPGSKGANYHKECSGPALDTVHKHSSEPHDDEYGEGMTIFGANFCPFVHRAWAALELLDAPYRMVEVDPYQKPKELLDSNPRGLVPALRIGKDKVLGESQVILEYLVDRYETAVDKPALLPRGDAYRKARCRLAVDQVNRTLIPSFYRYLQAQETEKQIEGAKEFVAELQKFNESMLPEQKGPFWDGSDSLGMVDIVAFPWVYRATIVLKHFRAFDMSAVAQQGGRFDRWMKAVFGHPAVKATTSNDNTYLDGYARYAENRPNTSQVANAINSGRGLP